MFGRFSFGVLALAAAGSIALGLGAGAVAEGTEAPQPTVTAAAAKSDRRPVASPSNCINDVCARQVGGAGYVTVVYASAPGETTLERVAVDAVPSPMASLSDAASVLTR